MTGGGVALSIVVPAYNEALRLPRTLDVMRGQLDGGAEQYEVIVVDDGSRDGTGEVVECLAGEFPRLRLVRHRVNRGYGAALRTGFEAAARAEASRGKGNVLKFCHWRQIERVIVTLSDREARGTIH